MVALSDLPKGLDPDRARQIARLRAMGFTQADIARQLGISQQTVSRYLKQINDAANASENKDAFLIGLLLGAAAVGVVWALAADE